MINTPLLQSAYLQFIEESVQEAQGKQLSQSDEADQLPGEHADVLLDVPPRADDARVADQRDIANLPIWDQSQRWGMSTEAVTVLESADMCVKTLTAEAPVSARYNATSITRGLPTGVKTVRIKAGVIESAEAFNMIQDNGGFQVWRSPAN